MLSLVRNIVLFPLISLLLVGCGKDSKSELTSGKTVIEFWHYQSGKSADAIDDLLQKFESAHPDIAVRAVYQGNPNQLKQKLDGSFASGAGGNPAVSMVYETWTDDFYKRGYIDPVQNHFDGPDGLTADEQNDFVKAFLEGNTWDGKLVTLPYNKSIYMLYMNMDMLNDAGYTTAPKTQSELADAVKKLTVHQGIRVSTYGMGVIPKGEAFTTLLLARGGKLVDSEGHPQFDSPRALDTLRLLKGLQYPEKHLYVNMDFMSMPFGNKLIGMFIYSSASMPYNKQGAAGKFKYAAAPIPSAPGATARYLMQGTNIAIFADKSDVERKAAWDLVKFLTSPANATYFAVRSGYMPIRYSMLEQSEFVKHMRENPDYAAACRLVLGDQGKQEPKVRAWEGIRTDLDAMVDQLLSRPDSDPQKLLADLQKKAEAKLH